MGDWKFQDSDSPDQVPGRPYSTEEETAAAAFPGTDSLGGPAHDCIQREFEALDIPDIELAQWEEAATHGFIQESLDETAEAVAEWSIESVVELAADAVYPGLGRVINITLKAKEVLIDVEALASPESPRDLHVPVLQLAGGIEIELNLHLPGIDGASDGGPRVTGFIMLGDDGLLGGWAIEKVRSEDAEQATRSPRQDAIEQTSAPPADASLYELIPHDLPKAVAPVEPICRAVIMREAASRIRRRLHAVRGLAGKALIVVYDDWADAGMWIIQRELVPPSPGWHIEIRPDTETGLMAVRIV